MTQQNIIRGQLTMFVFTNFQQSHIIKYASRKFERKYRHFKFQVQTGDCGMSNPQSLSNGRILTHPL